MPTFPNATASDWNHARARIARFARSHGLTADAAEELAQSAVVGLLTATYRRRSPYDPTQPGAPSLQVATGWLINQGKRYGVRRMAPGGTTYRRRADEPLPVRDTAPGWTDPARMAEEGEALAARMPRYAQRARADGLTPAGLALIAAGFGPLDDADAAKATPSVPQCGPGYTPPATGCPGLHMDTDPNPASRDAARLRCINDWRRVAGLPPLR